MKQYFLEEDEVVLYKGWVTLCNQNGLINLKLTNKNIILSSDTDEVKVYLVNDIKIYQEEPQIKINGKNVEIYLKSEELEISFESKNELKKFVNEATKLITGKSVIMHKVEKAKAVVEYVEETLGVDMATVVNGAVNNNKVAKSVGVVGKTASLVGKGIKSMINKDK